jgi:hypothetical protein
MVAFVGGLVGQQGTRVVMIVGGAGILPLCPCKVATAARVMLWCSG